MQIVNILLDSNQYSFDAFFDRFGKKWPLSFHPYRDKDAFGMIINDKVIGCALVPFPIVESGLVYNARENVLWPDAEACVSKHKAHLQITMSREGDPVSAHILFTKVIYSLLQQRTVVGVYLRPGLFDPSYYIKCAEEIAKGKLPTELWVHINSLNFEKEEGFSFYTIGMSKFGKKEFEIPETKKNFIDAYYALKELIKHAIENNIDFKNGDAIGTEDKKTTLSVSKGVKIKGTTIKIHI